MSEAEAPTCPRAERPAHVPEDRAVEFDIFNLKGGDEDVHRAYVAFQRENPDLFWTPFNGGHWVVTRADDIETVLADDARFSHRQFTVPWLAGLPRQIPLSLEPPEHTAYRKPLTRAFLPSAVNHLEGEVRAVTIALIEDFLPRGECEFVSEFAKILPIVVFLDLAGLPREDRHILLPFAELYFRKADADARQEGHRAISQYLEQKIVERRAHPGEDLLSTIINTDIDGGKMSLEAAVSLATNVVLGGLDTVAAMLTFVARFLADHPGHRQQLIDRIDDDAFLRNAVEELLRRHGISNMSRYVERDTDYKGQLLKQGDMIMPPNMLVGLDDRRVPDPLTVDFERKPIVHGVFGRGSHMCPGATLARRELLVFLQEWLKRIPAFTIKPGTKPTFATGVVNSIRRLELCWPH